jgi:sigma-B regulation protein RsbU (phosphoserine phosphatase)
MLARRLRRCGYAITVASSGLQALQLARSQQFDLILLDMIMPGLDGFQVLAKFKADPVLKETAIIMLSALDEENGIARCIEMGAEDYLAKPFNPVFLRARIGACLEKKRLHDKERATHEALQRSQKHLAEELTKAAGYVRSLLPPPLIGPIETEWCFQPSEQLGGDAFGYHWIDDDHFAIYLLDVCGHGVGAALLSVSVLNTLRAHTLPGADFRQPERVLAALNRAFRTENQDFLYFTLWYGVYRPATRQLSFASGGHPPALLVTSAGAEGPVITPVGTSGPAVGCFEDATFSEAVQSVAEGGRLLLFSDGIFEIFKPGGAVGTWDEFVKELDRPEILALRPKERLRRAQEIRGATALEDDFSLVEVRFH